MIRFILGVIAGSVAVWIWRDEMRDYAERRTRFLRSRAADQLRTAQQMTESALDTAKERISSGLEKGQEVIRPSEEKVHVVR
ncbi:MAG TPA: hypothetical protein VFO18_06890 [Methylomirabilota bacterium]|nr:hypothetical protein [Methylomirabilota bacterium]